MEVASREAVHGGPSGNHLVSTPNLVPCPLPAPCLTADPHPTLGRGSSKQDDPSFLDPALSQQRSEEVLFLTFRPKFLLLWKVQEGQASQRGPACSP